MTTLKNHRKKILISMALVSMLLIPLLMASRNTEPEIVIIEVIAKDMMFNETNPTFYIKPGTRVRLTLRNEDPGMNHDLVIKSLGIKTPIIKEGEQATIEFIVQEEGRFDYICSLHPRMMKGLFVVSNQSSEQRTVSVK